MVDFKAAADTMSADEVAASIAGVVVEGPSLIPLRGVNAGKPFPLPVQFKITIGRSAGNTLIILDSAVSRRHFEIYTDKHKWYVRDLNSRHGTFVNGFRIETMELEDGDRIRVGNMQLVFKDGS